MQTRGRAITALGAFAISLPPLALGATWAVKRAIPPAQLLQDQDLSLIHRLPADWVDPQLARVPKVRGRREFWAFEKTNVHGAALKLLETPRLREALFPGYPGEMFSDEKLWHDYFSRDFASTAWLPPLQPYSPYGILVYQSWVGCMDVFKRYGADGVIFGSSETFRSLVPQLISQAASGHPQRVLLCTTSSSYPQQAEWLAHEMAKPGMPHARWVILGVSLWSFYQGHANYLSVQSEKKSHWDHYLSSRYGHYGPDFKTAELFHPPAWDEVFSPNLASISKHRGRRKEILDAAAYLAAQPQAASHGTYLASSTGDAALFQKELASFTPTFPLLEGLNANICSAYDGDRLLEPVARAVGKIADHVVLYVPPISPRLRATIPACYQGLFAGTMSRFVAGSPGTVTLIQDKAEDYGLTDADYLYVDEVDGVVHYDANHTDFVGASKVSAQVASKLKQGGLL